MKKKISYSALIVILAIMMIGILPAADRQTIAIAVKVIKDVSHKGDNTDWTKAKPGELLYSGDLVRTGDHSIAIVKFMDNSMLRVRESSELKVFGEQKEGVFSKSVTVTRGDFSFDVQKQQENEKFTFSSPTSVAAIRGTEGEFGSTSTGDQLIVVDGLVNFLNSLSNQSVNVGTGQTGISNTDGTIFVRESTPGEKSGAQGALNNAHGQGTIKELDIQLQNKQGGTETLQIRYLD
jgi:hypothetical protein